MAIAIKLTPVTPTAGTRSLIAVISFIEFLILKEERNHYLLQNDFRDFILLLHVPSPEY